MHVDIVGGSKHTKQQRLSLIGRFKSYVGTLNLITWIKKQAFWYVSRINSTILNSPMIDCFTVLDSALSEWARILLFTMQIYLLFIPPKRVFSCCPVNCIHTMYSECYRSIKTQRCMLMQLLLPP